MPQFSLEPSDAVVCQLCSGWSQTRTAPLLTPTGTKQSLGLAIVGASKVSNPTCSGHRPACGPRRAAADPLTAFPSPELTRPTHSCHSSFSKAARRQDPDSARLVSLKQQFAPASGRPVPDIDERQVCGASAVRILSEWPSSSAVPDRRGHLWKTCKRQWRRFRSGTACWWSGGEAVKPSKLDHCSIIELEPALVGRGAVTAARCVER